MKTVEEINKEIQGLLPAIGRWNEKFYSNNRIYIDNHEYVVSDETKEKIEQLFKERKIVKRGESFNLNLLIEARLNFADALKHPEKISENEKHRISEEIKTLNELLNKMRNIL